MALRFEIFDAIESAQGNNEKAALAVCKLLNPLLSLEGNGWFDDDPDIMDLMYSPVAASAEEPGDSSRRMSTAGIFGGVETGAMAMVQSGRRTPGGTPV